VAKLEKDLDFLGILKEKLDQKSQEQNKMSINENVKYNIRVLMMKDIRKLPREDKVLALKSYIKGINDSINEKPNECLDDDLKKFILIYNKGYQIGTSYNVLERDSAKKSYNKQISRFLKKFEKKSLLGYLCEFFSDSTRSQID